MGRPTLTIHCVLAASALLFSVENNSPTASALQLISPVRYDCGPAYKEIKMYNETGFISSPNYPLGYPVQVRCIWVLKAPLGCNVHLKLNNIRGQSTLTGTCIDYLEVRIRIGTIWRPMLSSCHLVTTAVIVSHERLLWLKFVSDQSSSFDGFSAEWSTMCYGNVTKEDVSVCSSAEYSCPNLECIRTDYLCDGRNDCGCTRAGCDEVDCRPKTDFTEAECLGICLGAAFLMLIVLFYGCQFVMMLHAKFKECHNTGQYISRQSESSAPNRTINV